MKEERMEVLTMLKDGTITPEEAERLLSALGERERLSERPREHRGRRPPRPDEFRSAPFREFGQIFGGLGKTIGETMKSAVDAADIRGIRREFGDIGNYEEVEFPDQGFMFPEDTKLSIRQPAEKSYRGRRNIVCSDVRLLPSDSDMLRVEGAEDFRLRRKGNELVLVLLEEATVYVPQNCGELTVSLLDGSVTANDLAVRFSVHTMSGDIDLSGVPETVSAVTMSGDINVIIGASCSERADYTTMSGDVRLGLSGDWNGTFEATTLSGDVDFDVPGADVTDNSGFVGASVRAIVGGRPDDAHIKCNTLSGDVSVVVSVARNSAGAYTE